MHSSRTAKANRTKTMLVGGALLVAGLVLLIFGWSTPSLVLAAKAVMVLIGIVLVFQGANRLIEAIRGERIDLLFAFSMVWRSEEHTSALQSLMRISYAVFCLKKK